MSSLPSSANSHNDSTVGSCARIVVVRSTYRSSSAIAMQIDAKIKMRMSPAQPPTATPRMASGIRQMTAPGSTHRGRGGRSSRSSATLTPLLLDIGAS